MTEIIMFGAGIYVGVNWDTIKPKVQQYWADIQR